MGAIVYGATHGEYSDYRVAALFEDEKKAKAWVRTRKRKLTCCVCKGVGKLGPPDYKDKSKCWVCDGKGTTKGDGNDYSIEAFPWNPTGEEDA